MTTSSSLVDVSAFTTNAKLRSWGSAISAALVASGLTVTADTGQVNWATVTHPGAINTKAGYEIYRFNDSLQGANPIYFRIDYGTGAPASGAGPCTWLTVGTGSDGAGNITGTAAGMAVTQGTLTTTPSVQTSTTIGAAYSTSAGVCTIMTGHTSNDARACGDWVIARSCDTAGTPTSTATVVYRGVTSAGNAYTMTIVCNLLSPATNFTSRNVGAANFTPQVAVTAGTTVAVHKNYIIAPTPIPTLAAVTVNTTDALQWSIITVAPFGSTTHKYLALNALCLGFDSQASAGSAGALLWE